MCARGSDASRQRSGSSDNSPAVRDAAVAKSDSRVRAPSETLRDYRLRFDKRPMEAGQRLTSGSTPGGRRQPRAIVHRPSSDWRGPPRSAASQS